MKTAISSQKNWFAAISSTKKMDPSYLEVEKLVHSYFDPDRTFFFFCFCFFLLVYTYIIITLID